MRIYKDSNMADEGVYYFIYFCDFMFLKMCRIYVRRRERKVQQFSLT